MAKTRILGVYDSKEEALQHEKQLEVSQKIPPGKLVIVPPSDHTRVPLNFLTQRDLMSTSLASGAVWGATIGLVVSFFAFAVFGLPTPPFQSLLPRLLMYLLAGLGMGAVFGGASVTLASFSSSSVLNSTLASRLFRNKYLVVMVKRGHLNLAKVRDTRPNPL